MWAKYRRGARPLVMMILSVLARSSAASPSYTTDIKPIFDVKCVACHACYDSPCQLNLSHPDGLARGLSAAPFYDSDRVETAPTTRLFEDAQTEEGWRALGFSPVIGARSASSLLWAAIQHGNAHVLPTDAPVPPSLNVDVNAPRTCPTFDDYPTFAAENVDAGMPYGMARLSHAETELIRRWLDAGAPVDWAAPEIKAVDQAQINDWQRFLNGSSPRARLVARYFYEHVFLARLYFEGAESPQYYRLVRSRTPVGRPIDRVATRRPNDDPGVSRVYYRFEAAEGVLPRKNHMVFALSPEYLTSLDALFFGSDWSVDPGAAERWLESTNPFVAFEAIPQEARYRFLIDRSYYFISNFIRGPVCRGPISLNAIADRFFVAFLDPSADLDEDFVQRQKRKLSLPGSEDRGSTFAPELRRIRRAQRRYLRQKDRYLRDALPEGRQAEHLWSGDENARLTIFRHRDSAGVVRGWLGDETETFWVLDYPLFERLYYNLVANFDVFGSFFHQVSTRVYFDLIRAEAEDSFLLFLSPAQRLAYRESWYRGLHAQEKQSSQYYFAGGRLPVGLDLGGVSEKTAFIKRFEQSPSRYALPSSGAAVDLKMHQVARDLMDNAQPFVRFLPEVSLLHVVVDGSVEADRVYSLTHDRAFRNQSFMFAEGRRSEPERDGLTVALGIVGNYPNRIFKVRLDELDAFASALKSVSDDASYLSTVTRFAYFRSSEGLLEENEWIYRWQRPRDPIEAGRLDLNRYGDEIHAVSAPTFLERVIGKR